MRTETGDTGPVTAPASADGPYCPLASMGRVNEEAVMNRPAPERPEGMALEQLNEAVKSIFRKWRARRAAKAAGPGDGPENPSAPAANS